MIWWDCCCCYTQGCCDAVYTMISNVCTFFVFFPVFCLFPKHPLSFFHAPLFLPMSVFFIYFFLSHWPSLFWLGRASPLISWLPCPSGQPWRKPMGPLPCLTPACSSTNRPWPACSFSSRLLSSHQVWLRKQPPRGCLDQSNLAPAWLGLGKVVDGRTGLVVDYFINF